MTSDPQVERCLTAIRTLSSDLSGELRALSSEDWNRLSNCAPWRVSDLVAHIVVSGEGFAASIVQGLAGSVQPSISHEERDRRQEHLAAGKPTNAADQLDALTERFIGLYDGLDEAQLEAICFHRRGNRSVRWYAAHRLAEVAFHTWDFHVSLGREPVLAEEVAATLLPTLLESNAPRTYAAGLSTERGTGERYLLAVDGDPSARWLVTIGPDALTAVRGDAPADVTVTSSAAGLALVAYGRASLSELFQAGGVHLEGDVALADRFALLFPRP